MAREEEIFYQSGDMDTIKTLQRSCRTEENNFETFKLKSLEAVTSAGRKATKAVYEEVEDGSEIKKLTIEKISEKKKDEAEFEGDAFILTARTKVLVFRK